MITIIYIVVAAAFSFIGICVYALMRESYKKGKDDQRETYEVESLDLESKYNEIAARPDVDVDVILDRMRKEGDGNGHT